MKFSAQNPNIRDRALALFGRDDELALALAAHTSPNKHETVGSSIGTPDDYSVAREFGFWNGALSWWRAGFSVTPIVPTTKRPSTLKWVHGSNKLLDLPRDIDPACGIGLVLGLNGLLAVDVDRAEALPAIETFFAERGIRPARKWSKPASVTLIVYIAGATSAPALQILWSGSEKHANIDFLGNKKQTVVAGVHPAGGGRMFQCDIDPDDPAIPTISLADLLALVETAIEVQGADRQRYLGTLAKWWREEDLPMPDVLAELAPEDITAGPAKVQDGDGIFARLNATALANLDLWVPALFGEHAHRDGAGYRARAVWRNGESDTAVSISARGVKDHGGKGYNPVGLVREVLGACSWGAALDWLAERLGMTAELQADRNEPVDAALARAAATKAHNDDSEQPVDDAFAAYRAAGGKGWSKKVRRAIEAELAALVLQYGARLAPRREEIKQPLAPREGEPAWVPATGSLDEGRRALARIMRRIAGQSVVLRGRGLVDQVPELGDRPFLPGKAYDGRLSDEERAKIIDAYERELRVWAETKKIVRAAGYRGRFHVVEASAGTGKTTAVRSAVGPVLKAARDQGIKHPVVFYLVPYLALGEEFVRLYGPKAKIWRGRNAEAPDGEKMCKAPWRVAAVTARPRDERRYFETLDTGVSESSDPARFGALKARRDVSVFVEEGAEEPTAHIIRPPRASELANIPKDACVDCPLRKGCSYLAQFNSVDRAEVIVASHDVLSTGFPALGDMTPVAIVLDETPARLLMRETVVRGADALDSDAMGDESALQALGIVRKLVDRWTSFGHRITRDEVLAAMGLPHDWDFSNPKYRPSTASTDLPAIEGLSWLADALAKLIDRGGDEVLEPGATEESSKSALSRLNRLRRCHDFLVALKNERIEVTRGKGASGELIWLVRSRPTTHEMFDGVPIIAIDGTPPPVEILKQRWPNIEVHKPIRVKDHEGARRILVLAPSATSSALERGEGPVARLAADLRALRGGDTLAIGPKKAKKHLMADATYGALRGLDRFNGVPLTIVAGRPAPYEEVVSLAESLFGEDVQRQPWFMREKIAVPLRDGRVVDVEAISDPDPRVRATAQLVITDELRQADARSRPASNPVAIVHIQPDTVAPGLAYDHVVRIEDVELFGVDLGGGCLVPTRAGIEATDHKVDIQEVARRVRWWLDVFGEPYRTVRGALARGKVVEALAWTAEPKWPEGWTVFDDPGVEVQTAQPGAILREGGERRVGDAAPILKEGKDPNWFQSAPILIEENRDSEDRGRVKPVRLEPKRPDAATTFGRVVTPGSPALLHEMYPTTWPTKASAKMWSHRNRAAIEERMERLVATGHATRITVSPGRRGLAPVAGYLNHAAGIIPPAVEFPTEKETNPMAQHRITTTPEQLEADVRRVQRAADRAALRAIGIPQFAIMADILEAGGTPEEMAAKVAAANLGPCDIGLEFLSAA